MIILSNYIRFRLGKFLLLRKVILLYLLFFDSLLIAHPHLQGEKKSVFLNTYAVTNIMVILKDKFRLRHCFEDKIWTDIKKIVGDVESVAELESRLCFFFEENKKKFFDEGIKSQLKDIIDKNESSPNSSLPNNANPIVQSISTMSSEQSEAPKLSERQVTKIISDLQVLLSEQGKFDESIWNGLRHFIASVRSIRDLVNELSKKMGEDVRTQLMKNPSDLKEIFYDAKHLDSSSLVSH